MNSFVQVTMASTSVSPANSVPDSAAAAYDLSRSFQNLGLGNHDGFFNTSPGIAASSSISPPLILLPAETQEGDLEFSLNQPIRQEANLGYHSLNNGGNLYTPFFFFPPPRCSVFYLNLWVSCMF